MILVTGAAGFIGSNLVKSFNDSGRTDIIVVDNLEKSCKHRNLNLLRFSDYLDKDDFINSLDSFSGKGIEVVFHNGACSDTLENNGRYMMENNYKYSKILLDFCIKNGIRFIYASSASVYGEGRYGFREERVCEYPLNIYAFSKFAFDQYVREIKNPGVQISALRYFNVYGPQENHKERMASIIYTFYRQMLGNNRMELFQGSDIIRRDFIHVNDIIRINHFMYNNPHISGIFNCGTGEAVSFLEIAEIINSLYQLKGEIRFIDFPENLTGKYQNFTQADISSLRKAGYNEKFITISQGIADYLQILKSHDGYFSY